MRGESRMERPLKLSAPTTVVFVISVILALLSLAIRYAAFYVPSLSVPVVPPFWLMALAFAVLAIGCLFRRA